MSDVERSWIYVWGIRQGHEVTVTIKTGEKFFGTIGNSAADLTDTPLDQLILRLDPRYGRGQHHKVKADQIVAVTEGNW